MTESRRTIREQVGVSLNASDLRLESRQPGLETPLVRIAALGAAALPAGDTTKKQALGALTVPLVAAALSARGKTLELAAVDLSVRLLHLREAGQREGFGEAAVLFAEWVGHRSRLAHVAPEVRLAFAARVLQEWISPDRCTACGGSRKRERNKSGQWVRPRGSMQRNAVFAKCAACGGSGRSPIRHAERARFLGLTHAQYDADRWAGHFIAGLRWLEKGIAPRIVWHLTAQLERGRNRP